MLGARLALAAAALASAAAAPSAASASSTTEPRGAATEGLRPKRPTALPQWLRLRKQVSLSVVVGSKSGRGGQGQCAEVAATGTLAEAQAAARAGVTKAGCAVVRLEPRPYILSSSLVLGKEDSNVAWVGAGSGAVVGADAAGIVGSSFARAPPTPPPRPATEFTAAIDVPPSAWTARAGAGGGGGATVFELDALRLVNASAFGGPDGPAGSAHLRLLVQVGGGAWVPMRLARWPNVAMPTAASQSPPWNWSTIASVPNASECGADCRAFAWPSDTDRPLRWAKAASEGRLFVHGFWKYLWRDTLAPITNVDATTRTLRSPRSLSESGVTDGGLWYAYNLAEELDAPGEFVANASSGVVLAVLPGPDAAWQGCVQNGAVVCKTRLVPATASFDLVSVQGAVNVAVTGVAVTGSVGVGVHVQGATNVTVDACELTNLGAGVVAEPDAANRSSTGVSLTRSLVRHTDAASSSFTGGDRATLTPPGFLIENNLFMDFGSMVYTYNPGVHLAGVGAVVRRNEFASAFHVAVLYSGNEHVIELNEFHHVVTVTFDSGAVYAGRDLSSRGTVVRHNLFHHLESDGAAKSPCNAYTSCIRQGVYIDDFEGGVNITGNIFFAAMNGFFSNCGSDFTFANNLFVQTGLPIRQSGAAVFRSGPPDGVDGLFDKLHAVPFDGPVWSARYPRLAERYRNWTVVTRPPPDSASPLGNVMAVNAVVNSTGPTAWETSHGWKVNARGVFSLDAKFFTSPASSSTRFNVTESNLALADPGWAHADPAGSLCFALAPGSPLFKVGWQAIPESDIGPEGGPAATRCGGVAA